MNKIDKFSTEKNAHRRDVACRVPATNALKGQNNSAWGNALRIMTSNALHGTETRFVETRLIASLRSDGNSGLLRYARNDVRLTPALSKGEGAFPSLETERSRSFGGVREGQNHSSDNKKIIQ